MRGEPCRTRPDREDAAVLKQADHVHMLISIPPLAPLVTNLDDAALRLIPRGTGALKLLANYVGMLEDDEALATPALRRLVVTQIYDLAALAIGATRDAAAIAEGRGVRAARLRAIKADIAERLAQDDLTVAAVASRQRISESYVRKLFESEGSSFSEWVLGERLIHAHRMLTDHRFAGRSITSVAFDAGLAMYLTSTAHSAAALAPRRPKFVPKPNIANHKRVRTAVRHSRKRIQPFL